MHNTMVLLATLAVLLVATSARPQFGGVDFQASLGSTGVGLGVGNRFGTGIRPGFHQHHTEVIQSQSGFQSGFGQSGFNTGFNSGFGHGFHQRPETVIVNRQDVVVVDRK